jgi:hypothetical protein
MSVPRCRECVPKARHHAADDADDKPTLGWEEDSVLQKTITRRAKVALEVWNFFEPM